MGSFGDTFTLGPSGSPVSLPDPTEFSSDTIRQGGIHVLLSGKRREDKFSNAHHFRIAWRGLTEAEVAVIEALLETTEPLVFTYWRGTYNVVLGNSEPVEWSLTGYGSLAITLEESE